MCSDVVMEFKDGANSSRICPVLLKRRSLCVMKGESRYRWKHGIVNRKYDINPVTHRVIPRDIRVSITLRKVRREPCQCQYKEYCDWDRGGEMAVPSDELSARRVEDVYVNGVYECIASHFDETRFSSWKGVKRFLSAVPPYSVVYDVGCGNGKYLANNDNLLKIGCDMSQVLCEIVNAKGFMVIRANALCLPFREGADAVLLIAVLHHMASSVRRQTAIREILRVLKPGGKACISVWSMDQCNSEYSKMRRHKDSLPKEKQSDRLKIHDGKEFVQQDLLVPWQVEHKDATYFRYYHVFAEGEMEELIRSVGGCQIDSVEKEQDHFSLIRIWHCRRGQLFHSQIEAIPSLLSLSRSGVSMRLNDSLTFFEIEGRRGDFHRYTKVVGGIMGEFESLELSMTNNTFSQFVTNCTTIELVSDE
ncbi:2OG-Fe(II) oxygenase super [Parelaphostrongylus tenuis]|uniref:2OG-Fe(II) oxygenase super n=1 Tax=Parelaphostrongylus tenuis TaxID=148309 RepID=A0AAD5QMM2_PARTN|nr:2OG-Fe(II) oxygenase super [Parelaphostrongylus tenuis]